MGREVARYSHTQLGKSSLTIQFLQIDLLRLQTRNQLIVKLSKIRNIFVGFVRDLYSHIQHI
jgi:hypothetical protein